MAKIHELLAVENSLQGQAEKTKTDLKATFTNKRHLFQEKRVTFQSNEEGRPAVTEEQSDIQTTVGSELAWIGKHLAKAIDASYQIHIGNTTARADIEVQDATILKDVPATALLELEKTIKGVQELVYAAPTLDPAKGFTLDAERGKGIFRAREVVKTRTRKAKKVLVKYEATEKHPAQTEVIDVDEPIGTIREQEWSAMLTPAEKADMLGRCEDLLRAIKKARSRANDLEVNTTAENRIGAKLLGYIFGAKIDV